MWSRKSIKDYAKNFLREHYWKAFLVCLIVTILSEGSSNSNSSNNNNNNYNYYNNNQIINEMNDGSSSIVNSPITRYTSNRFMKSPISYIAGGSFAVMFLLIVILLVTVGYALEVGKARFFLRGFKDEPKIGTLFSTFNREEYLGIVKAQFVRGFYTVLWTLLFIIPGIIKGYEYRMVPYILSENPNLSPSEAITMSRNMTDGHKMDMFILSLSFLGWDILGLFFFGIGGIFVNPYKEATEAKLYNILSSNDDRDDYTIEEDVIFQ